MADCAKDKDQENKLFQSEWITAVDNENLTDLLAVARPFENCAVVSNTKVSELRVLFSDGRKIITTTSRVTITINTKTTITIIHNLLSFKINSLPWKIVFHACNLPDNDFKAHSIIRIFVRKN